MRIEYFKHYSSFLNREMEFKVYGSISLLGLINQPLCIILYGELSHV